MKTTKGMRIATVWKLCLAQWDWGCTQTDIPIHKVSVWKEEWCHEHGYAIPGDCFFCDVAARKTIEEGIDWIRYEQACHNCPGRAVYKTFNCEDPACAYDTHPEDFRKKLRRMNRKRLKMNREK